MELVGMLGFCSSALSDPLTLSVHSSPSPHSTKMKVYKATPSPYFFNTLATSLVENKRYIYVWANLGP